MMAVDAIVEVSNGGNFEAVAVSKLGRRRGKLSHEGSVISLSRGSEVAVCTS